MMRVIRSSDLLILLEELMDVDLFTIMATELSVLNTIVRLGAIDPVELTLIKDLNGVDAFRNLPVPLMLKEWIDRQDNSSSRRMVNKRECGRGGFGSILKWDQRKKIPVLIKVFLLGKNFRYLSKYLCSRLYYF